MMRCGTLGVGLGGLVTNHIAAIVAVGWLLITDQLLLGAHGGGPVDIPRPAPAPSAMGPRRDHGRALLPAWAAASNLVGHATAFAALGAWAPRGAPRFTNRRDNPCCRRSARVCQVFQPALRPTCHYARQSEMARYGRPSNARSPGCSHLGDAPLDDLLRSASLVWQMFDVPEADRPAPDRPCHRPSTVPRGDTR
jgi:hypothetical protein